MLPVGIQTHGLDLGNSYHHLKADICIVHMGRTLLFKNSWNKILILLCKRSNVNDPSYFFCQEAEACQSFQTFLQEWSLRSSGMLLYGVSNLWLYGTCRFVSWLTDFCNWSPAKEKAFLNVLTWEWFSVPLPLYPSKMMVCKINPLLLRKERNKNVWCGNEHIWDGRSWEQEEPLKWSWKILYSGRIQRSRKAALPHCLPAAQRMVKLHLFLKRWTINQPK